MGKGIKTKALFFLSLHNDDSMQSDKFKRQQSMECHLTKYTTNSKLLKL